jgi:enoyl-CoA hydratase/carnithine racemase
VLTGDDFDADIAERYGWVNRTLDDDDLDSFVDTLVRRLASFDRETFSCSEGPGQSVRDADSYRASVEQRHVLLNPRIA